MTNYADLELGLHRRDAESYAVEFRFSLPDSEAEIRIGQGQPAVARFDFEGLQAVSHDLAAYGKLLGEQLFADSSVKTAFGQARAAALSQDYSLRFRLLIGPTAVELHSLRWEALCDPENGASFFTGENLLFSRYLSSLDWRPVRLRPKRELRALVAVANPANLGDYQLAAVDVAGERATVQDGLKGITISHLPDEKNPVSLDNIINHLRDGDYDLLYLVAHGVLVKDEPWLFLENAQGEVDRVSGTDLVNQIKEMQTRPRLVILASCQSAANRGEGSHSALGPRLAEAGIPAVIAMQGNVSIDTLKEFMPVFFEELQADGQIDRAVAVARGKVRRQVDFWMPALFMRLKSGRIWYEPGFGEAFEKWPSLIRSIRKNQCTPILGPGLYESKLGSLREIAQRWAEAYHYPMAPHERESLPQVAQYLAVNQDPLFPYDELTEYLRQDIQARFADILAAELLKNDVSLDKLIEGVGAHFRAEIPTDPYEMLAQLPLPIYITTNLHNLLGGALKEAGKDPQVVICPWNEYIEQIESVFDLEPGYRPSVERPLVYHLFGRLDEPESVVLTEDAYFDFLIGVTSNKDLIPAVVRAALVNSALLFLGFQMDDWNFRVLFRTILALQGGGRRSLYAHIAAQIEPEEGRILEPERARRFLEKYFAKGADISLYWGSAEDFVEELYPRYLESNR